MDHCFPEWDIWTQFVYSDLGRAMNLDGLANSHPVEVPINDPAEARSPLASPHSHSIH